MMRQVLSPRQQTGASSRMALHTGLLSFKVYLRFDHICLKVFLLHRSACEREGQF